MPVAGAVTVTVILTNGSQVLAFVKVMAQLFGHTSVFEMGEVHEPLATTISYLRMPSVPVKVARNSYLSFFCRMRVRRRYFFVNVTTKLPNRFQTR